MNDATLTPKNFEEWKASAPMDELVQGLYERLEEAQKINAEQTTQLIAFKENRNMLYTMLQSHKHDNEGNVMLPAGFVKFND